VLVRIDLFAEDRAHEQFLPGLIERLVRERGHESHIRVVSARGGHPRVAKELETYQKVLEKTGGAPDLLVVGIDANCQGFQRAKKLYQDRLSHQLQAIAVIAAPDPHIERWYMIDGVRFEKVVGIRPKLPKKKCDRDKYKIALEDAVRDAGHVPTLGGVEFGPDIARVLSFYHAGKSDTAFSNFVDELREKLNVL
jgi:hypothetical protein